MDRIVESLYRMTGIDFEESLTYPKPDDILNELLDMFGSGFNEEPKCSEVCNYIKKELCPYLDVVDCLVSIKDKDEELFVPISNEHTVLKYGNKLYDFTNQQYSDYPGYGENTEVPRVFILDKNNEYINGNMKLTCK